MSNYWNAARVASSWYAPRYPGSTINPDKVVIHTTEGTSLPTYSGGATAPTYTAVPNFRLEQLEWYAHFPDEMSARALKNNSGGVETNTDDCIQVELVGTCSPASSRAWGKTQHILWSEAPEWALLELAKFVVDVHKRHDIPIVGPEEGWLAYGPDARVPGRTPASYGASPVRFTYDQWNKFSGFCGHQHVPENVHGDPGKIDWAHIKEYAETLMNPEPEKSLVAQAFDHVNQAIALLGEAKKKSKSPRPGITLVRQTLRGAAKSLKKVGNVK